MNRRPDKTLLRVSLPKWFRVFYAIGAPLTLIFFLIIAVLFNLNGFTFPGVIIILFVLVTVGIALHATPHFYSMIWVTDYGLRWDRPLGLRDKEFKWDDILTVSRPRFGYPGDVAYIVSKSGDKISVVKSMDGYTYLLEIIQLRAPNLTPKRLPKNLLPASSSRAWKQLLILFALFVMYVIVRKILGF